VGNRVKAKVVKNKVAAPFKVAEFDIMFSEGGISYTGDLLDTALELGVVSKSGNTHSFGDVKLGVGRENAKIFIRDNAKISNEIEKLVRAKAKSPDIVEQDGGSEAGGVESEE
jgi:recombination protein RecA